MADVLIISTSVIQAASHKEQTQRIDLTPWDLQLLPVHSIQKGLLFHKPKPPQNEEYSQSTLIQHLKTSLSSTLDFFAPLAGRLVMTERDDNTTSSFVIDCNNAGAEFVHAIADSVSMADIIEPIYVPSIVHSFFPLNGVKNYEGISKPLLAVQVTELVDGIFIGCTINHTVADGTSFWHFFNSWADISRGFDHISKPPILQRWFLDGIKCPIRILFSFDKHHSVKRIIRMGQGMRMGHLIPSRIFETECGIKPPHSLNLTEQGMQIKRIRMVLNAPFAFLFHFR